MSAKHVGQHAAVVVQVDGQHLALLGGLQTARLDRFVHRTGEEVGVRVAVSVKAKKPKKLKQAFFRRFFGIEG